MVFNIKYSIINNNVWRCRVACWPALAAVTAWTWAASDRALRRAEVPTSVVVREDVPYHDARGRALALDIYLPPPGAPMPAPGPGRPAILAIHGGSWIGGSKRLFRPGPWARRPMAIRLAESGYVVVAADYRLARPGEPGWPGARDDLREAVRWIRRHAGELGVDPGRIAALGQSAGGHLAAILGTSSGLSGPDDAASRVQAVVDFYGPSDLERLPGRRVRALSREPVRALLGDGSAPPSPMARDASPVHRVRGEAAPMLLLHGTRDAWVPIAQSEELAASLEAAGVRHRLVRVEGARHGFGLEVNDPEVPDTFRDLLSEILAFLKIVWNAPSR